MKVKRHGRCKGKQSLSFSEYNLGGFVILEDKGIVFHLLPQGSTPCHAIPGVAWTMQGYAQSDSRERPAHRELVTTAA